MQRYCKNQKNSVPLHCKTKNLIIMEKGDIIYIVKAEGTLDDGAKAFINYADARKYAEDWANVTADEISAELGSSEKVRVTIKQEEKVDKKHGTETLSKIPFEIEVFADNYNEDYCNIQVIKTGLN